MDLIRQYRSDQEGTPMGFSTAPAFQFQHAQVAPAMLTYPADHLLGLPSELRTIILKFIAKSVAAEMRTSFNKPTTSYEGLHLVCRQLWHDIRPLLAVIVVPASRADLTINYTLAETTTIGLETLALELPFIASPLFYSQAAHAFQKLAPSLTDLRLYFTGKDCYGTQVYIHGCGNCDPNTTSTSRKLPITGQGIAKRLYFMNQLAQLTKLKSLVVYNANIPLLQSYLFTAKPNLRRLQLVTDPRSTVHKDYTITSIGALIKAPTDAIPSVQELEISANAALTSLQVAGKVAATLKHLTWIVPDMSRQSSGGIQVDWCSNTSTLLQHLRYHNRIKSMRVCFEGAIYEGAEPYGTFMWGFKHNLPFITSLETLELHLTSRSSFFGNEILDAVPYSLKRLYVSDTFAWPAQFIPELERKYVSEDLFDAQSMIGEDLARQDVINMNKYQLGFIGYAYHTGRSYFNWDSAETGPDEFGDLRLRLLKVNGRLLDRELNRRPKNFRGLRVTWKDPDPVDVAYDEDEEVDDLDMPLIGPYKARFASDPMEEYLASLLEEGIGEDDEYFSIVKEREAELVFMAEEAARAEELPTRKYPVDLEFEDDDHWMSERGLSI